MHEKYKLYLLNKNPCKASGQQGRGTQGTPALQVPQEGSARKGLEQGGHWEVRLSGDSGHSAFTDPDHYEKQGSVE